MCVKVLAMHLKPIALYMTRFVDCRDHFHIKFKIDYHKIKI